MLYTGLDLHRSFSYITTMNDKGEIVGQKKLPSNGEVVEFLKEFVERKLHCQIFANAWSVALL